MKTIHTYSLYMILLAVLYTGVSVVYAGTVSVSNTVTTEANTGNSGGHGRATVESSVRTEVNGEVVVDDTEKKVSNDGEAVSVEQNISYTDTAEFAPVESTEDEVFEEGPSLSLQEDVVMEEPLAVTGADTESEWKLRRAFKLFLTTYVFWWL